VRNAVSDEFYWPVAFCERAVRKLPGWTSPIRVRSPGRAGDLPKEAGTLTTGVTHKNRFPDELPEFTSQLLSAGSAVAIPLRLWWVGQPLLWAKRRQRSPGVGTAGPRVPACPPEPACLEPVPRNCSRPFWWRAGRGGRRIR
jgi:hypothetical protein